jgi:hypothetical protein
MTGQVGYIAAQIKDIKDIFLATPSLWSIDQLAKPYPVIAHQLDGVLRLYPSTARCISI